MTPFKPFPELVIESGADIFMHRILTKAGDVVFAGSFRSEEEAQRLVDCWNACRKLHNPAAHLSETDEYVKRLETLRKEAWSRAMVAEELVSQLRADPGVSALSLAEGAAILAEAEQAA